MLCRAPNEANTKPYQGVSNADNPDGDLNRAHLLHLLDLMRGGYAHYVAYTEKQLIAAYEERGIHLCRWILGL
jgi:hypothetical protein